MNDRGRLVVVTMLVIVTGAGLFLAPTLGPGAPQETAVEPPTSGIDTDQTTPDTDQTTPDTDQTTPDTDQDTAEPTEGENDRALTVAELVEPCAADPPADYADASNNSVIGWVDGVWYDEPLSINTTDGVSQDELENLTARATARVEAMRCLAAEEGAPTVTVESRSEFRDGQSGGSASSTRQIFENTRLETMLLVSQQQNAVEQQSETTGESVAAFYTPLLGEITLITNDSEQIDFDESTLAHELGHAVQDQQFDLAEFDGRTTDTEKGKLGLLEGDVTRLERQYSRACVAGIWVESCLGVEETPGDDGRGDPGESDEGVDPDEGAVPAGPPNWGVYFIEFQPYNDGPAFVDQLYEEGGWEAVNERYEDPPESVLPVARPGTDEVTLANVTVPDRSSDRWNRVRRAEGQDYDTIGVAGVSAMFLAPSFESAFAENIYPPESVLNTGPGGRVDTVSPVDYWHPETEGWRGDRFYAYRNASGDRGAVWKLAWASEQDSEPFVDGYVDLIEYRGGQQVGDDPLTYTFGPGSEFDMAVSVRPDDDTVTVVTAPTAEQLQAVHDAD